MRRNVRLLLIVACGVLLLAGYFWRKNSAENYATAPAPQVATKTEAAPAAAAAATAEAALPATEPQTTAARNAQNASAAARAAKASNSQANPAKTGSANPAASANPPLSKAELDELIARHDCNNVPRTSARLASDLEYFELASEKWSDAMLTAYQSDLISVPSGPAKASSIQAVSALIQRCVKFDQLQAAKPDDAPGIPKIDWSEYPDWASKVDVYDAKQIENLIAKGQVKLLLQRARQNLEIFTKLPGVRGDLAYRDFRALQILAVPLSKSDQAGFDLLQHLLRIEIIARTELQAQQLMQQIKTTSPQ